MSLLGWFGERADLVTPTFFWALLAFTVAVGIGVGVFIAAGKEPDEAVHVVTACGINGHYYRAHDTGWRCATCDERVPRDGEFHDQTKDGVNRPGSGGGSDCASTAEGSDRAA